MIISSPCRPRDETKHPCSGESEHTLQNGVVACRDSENGDSANRDGESPSDDANRVAFAMCLRWGSGATVLIMDVSFIKLGVGVNCSVDYLHEATKVGELLGFRAASFLPSGLQAVGHGFLLRKSPERQARVTCLSTSPPLPAPVGLNCV